MNTSSLRVLALPGIMFLAGSLPIFVQAAPAPAAASSAAAPAASSASSPSSAAKPGIAPQLQALVAKINAKLQAGAHTEQELAPELKEFDDLLAAHKGETTDDVAQAAVMRAALYFQQLDDQEKGLALLKQFVADFPNSAPAKSIGPQLPMIEAQAKAGAASAAIRRALVPGAAFPDFPATAKDLAGAPLSVARYHGKIVLVDFWATWCGPCVQEMPNVIAAYNKYHEQGFEIIGVSLDDEKQNGLASLQSFIKDHKMPWAQFYDGKYWQNELAVKYGVQSIPHSLLLDGNGHILAVDPRGSTLAPAIEKALATLAPAPKPAN